MKSEQELPEYLTLQEISQMLKVHPNTLRTWDNNGTLKAVRIGTKKSVDTVDQRLRNLLSRQVRNKNGR